MDGKDHEHFMREALHEGEKALTRAEVPVGCVVVYKDEIIARASNRVNELYNVRRQLKALLNLLQEATMHAEIVAIEYIAAAYGNNANEVLAECTLYVTCEPCIMCAGALACVFIKRVYFGCHNDRFGGCSSVLNLHERSTFPNSSVHRGFPCVSGILKEEAIALLKKFYTCENPRVEDSKKKRKKRSHENAASELMPRRK